VSSATILMAPSSYEMWMLSRAFAV
ncbi:uncharacterized protein METZ01_LOCUS114441, partial [marine metagenome]